MASVEMSIEEWKKNVLSNQKNISNSMAQSIWDSFDFPNDKKYLFKKIATPMFGNELKDEDDLGLSEDKKKIVNNILEKCVKYSTSQKKIRIAVIFVFVYVKKNVQTYVPLIRVMSSNKNHLTSDVPNNVLIDHLGRVYTSLSDYEKNNTWDLCWLCIPKNGFYTFDLKVTYIDQSSRGEVLNAIDKVSTVTNIAVSVGMVGGTIMSLFPPTSPIGMVAVTASSVVGAPSAVYGVGRSVYNIIDRYSHEQSISLLDSEARQCWLATASAVVSIGALSSVRLLASSARAGNVVSSGSRALCTGINITSVSLSGISIINSAYELSQKDSFTTLDVFQFSTSIFFFTHSVVSFKTANSIIKDARRSEIMEMRNSSKRQRIFETYLQVAKETFPNDMQGSQPNEMLDQAKFIREMKRINNVNEFYQHFQLTRDGQFHINNELATHPRAYLQLTETERIKLISLSKDLHKNHITINDFNKRAMPVMKKYNIQVDKHRAEMKEYLKQKFGVNELSEIKIGNKDLGGAKPNEINQLYKVIKNSFYNGDFDYLKLVDKLAEKQKTKSITEYAAAGEYAIQRVEKEIANRMNANPNRPNGKARNFYKTQVINELLTDQMKMKELSDSFTSLQKKFSVGSSKFKTRIPAANYYDNHPYFPKISNNNILTPEEYFQIATEMAGSYITDVKWTQDGSSLKGTFFSEERRAMFIRYDNLGNGTSVIATLYANDEIEDTRLYNSQNETIN